jgi:hypothetical protein
MLKFLRYEHVSSEVEQDQHVDEGCHQFENVVQEIQEDNVVNIDNTEQSSETNTGLTNEETTVTTVQETEITLDVKDIGKWPQFLNNKIRKHIIEKGPESTEGQGIEYPRGIQGRKFSENNYYRKLSNGELVKRRWHILQKCRCCILFRMQDF